jgi:hypothetical protein
MGIFKVRESFAMLGDAYFYLHFRKRTPKLQNQGLVSLEHDHVCVLHGTPLKMYNLTSKQQTKIILDIEVYCLQHIYVSVPRIFIACSP